MTALKAERFVTGIVCLDTEFTGLTGEPLLLSVGMVADGPGGHEFYAEVTDEARLGAASAFTRNIVLPQFGRVAGAGCTYAELGGRAAGFVEALTFPRERGRRLTVAYESDRDWALLERAIRQCDEKRWLDLRAWLKPINVYNVAGFVAGERAADAYFDAQRVGPIWRHHALCDARALRFAHKAATASTSVHDKQPRVDESPPGTSQPEPRAIRIVPPSLAWASTGTSC